MPKSKSSKKLLSSSPYDDEIAQLLGELAGNKGATGRFAPFIKEISPKLHIPEHLVPLIEVLEQSRDTPQRILLSMPPQHGKSTTIKHAYPYHLLQDPTKTHAYVTYADRLTKSQARHIRRLCREAGVKFAPGATALDHWETLEGGGVVSTSVAGALTGKTIDGVLVIDDPFKDRADAESPVQRQKVWEFFTDVAMTRLHKTSSVVIVHTRWHQDDLIGRISKDLKHEGWTYINLPAISEDGKALWPEVHSLDFLESQRGKLGEYSFSALYQGTPRPRGADVFGEPARFLLPTCDAEWRAFLEGKYLIISVDPAATVKTSADYSVIMVFAKDELGSGGKGWVLDVQRVQKKVPDVVDMIKKTWGKWQCRIAVEAVGGFKALPQMIERIDPALRIGTTIKEITPTRDKFLRSQPVAAAWNDGRVHVPTNAEWSTLFLDEVLGFTGLGDRYDDQVDALGHAWNTLAGMKVRRRRVRLGSGPFG